MLRNFLRWGELKKNRPIREKKMRKREVWVGKKPPISNRVKIEGRGVKFRRLATVCLGFKIGKQSRTEKNQRSGRVTLGKVEGRTSRIV